MLRVKDISFSYQEGESLLKGISFSLGAGMHMSVMGESGCGKSTLLKLVYGLLDAQQGTIHWNDRQILGPAFHLVPGMEFFKYVAQDFDLMPFTSVADNISKFLSRTEPEESEQRTTELLGVIEMEDMAEEKVKNLSGGQKQRVAIARALAKEPELLLLDEPFGQIDNFKKNSLRRMLFSYLKEKNIACIVATHDTNDALSFADKMIVMRDGKLIADGAPRELYADPGDKYVATLFDDVNEIDMADKKILLYPNRVHIVSDAGHRSRVLNSYFKGTHWLIELAHDDQVVYARHHRGLDTDLEVFLKFS